MRIENIIKSGTMMYAGALTSLALMLSPGLGLSQHLPDSIMATINGEPIETKEYLTYLKKYRSSVYSYFISEYRLTDSAFQWTKNYGAENPSEVLKRKALNELLLVKTQQLLMKEKGLMNDLSYSYFLQELHQVNAQRKIARQNNEVIYGPVQYSERTYFEYVFTNNIVRLKQNLEGTEIFFDEETLNRHYQQIKDQYFKKEDNSYLSFSEVKEFVKREYIDRQYEKFITQQLNKAIINLNQNLYDKLSIP
ncbi:MAG: hypothetical protein K2X86_18010 [Cytophagaceae bacterium]|nr:hypothetical protein [Cytophagaceae bacterium]